MNLFGSEPSPVSQTPASPLAQILAMIPKTGEENTGLPPQQNGQQAAIPQQQAQQGQSAQNGGSAYDSLSGLYDTAGNLQTLPWLSTGQNMASFGQALGQNANNPFGSALSALAGIFQ